MTSKGQVTVPVHIRQRLGLQAGSEVEFINDPAGVLLRKTEPDAPTGLAELEAFSAYLDRVTGIIDLGMSSDEFCGLMRE